MTKVLLTGATGFLGAHIAESLVATDIEVIALKRSSSDCWRLSGFAEQINWVELDGGMDWQLVIQNEKPDILIHAAWIGVEALERNDVVKQEANLEFLCTMLKLAKKAGIKKIIGMGSQAEYGIIHGKVSETSEAHPVNAYGQGKKRCAELLESFCSRSGINWIWLRLFSFFGEKENENWFIPSVIRNLQQEKEMNMTGGEQRYAYLYVRDFSVLVKRIVTQPVASGIYNVSADQTRSLKEIVTLIREKINPSFCFHFGAIPYREGQSMHIEGDIQKLKAQLGPLTFTNFEMALDKTIRYYTHKTQI